jgi:hypothetical protein
VVNKYDVSFPQVNSNLFYLGLIPFIPVIICVDYFVSVALCSLSYLVTKFQTS